MRSHTFAGSLDTLSVIINNDKKSDYGNLMNAKPKVLFIGPYPPPYAGPEVAVKLLMESPLSEMADIRLLKINVRKSNAEKGKVNLRSFVAFFGIMARLFWSLLMFRPKVVYYYVTATTWGWLCKDCWVILLSRLMGSQVVIHMRAGHFKFNYRSASKLTRWIIRFTCLRCVFGLVQSQTLRDQFKGILPDDRIRVVHNLIDVNRYHNPTPTHNQSNTVFFMGHLSFAKGYCDLLKAIPVVVDTISNVKFVFAGTSNICERNIFYEQTSGRAIQCEDPQECFNKYIKGKYDKNYEYVGILDETAKLQMLRQCAIFTLPSYSEGFSMAVLEAIAMAKPIVCTPVGALGEVVKPQGGILIQAGDVVALQQALISLLSDKILRDRMAEFNHQYARENFSQEIVYRRLYACFSEI